MILSLLELTKHTYYLLAMFDLFFLSLCFLSLSLSLSILILYEDLFRPNQSMSAIYVISFLSIYLKQTDQLK